MVHNTRMTRDRVGFDARAAARETRFSTNDEVRHRVQDDRFEVGRRAGMGGRGTIALFLPGVGHNSALLEGCQT